MICATDILDTAINTDCPTPYGMEHNGYLTLRSGLRFKSETDLTVSFVPSEAIIPVYHPAFDAAYKPKSEGEINEYGLFKFNKSIELFLIANVPLTQKQVLQLKNEDWCFVGKQKDGQIIVIGYERGLALNKTSQEFLSTTTHGGILLTFEEKYVNTGMLFGAAALYAYKDFEVITGFSIDEGGTVYVAVDADKSCKVILSNGSILTSTAGVINTMTLIAGEVIILVQKGTELLSFGSTSFTGNLNFVVSDKNDIKLTDCVLTTPMCDAILDVLIENGTVTGTHRINFTDNIAAPSAGKVTTVEGLGWTVILGHSIGELYGGGRIVYIDEALMIIAALQPMAFINMYNNSVNYARLEADLILYNGIAHEGYSDWTIPTREEALASIENVVERLIVEGMDELEAYSSAFWTNEVSYAPDAHLTVNWNGIMATSAESDDIETRKSFLIRKEGVH